MPSINRPGGSGLCNNHSCVEIPSLVHQTNITLGGCSCAVAEEIQSSTPPTADRQCPSHTKSFAPGSLPFIREILQSTGFSEDIIDVIIASWRPGTRRQYAVYLRKWAVFCAQQQKDPLSPSLQTVLEFLHTLYNSGLSYSSLSVARSALASISFAQGNTVSIGGHPLICQYLKGIFNTSPSLKQSLSTWNPNTVLQYLRTWSPANHISLKQLSYKLMMLMLLTTGQRGQTLIACRVDHMDLRVSRAVLWLSTTLKTSKPTFHQAPLEIKAFPDDRRICPFTYLKEYLRRTVKLRQTKQLFIQL